jgi:transposase
MAGAGAAKGFMPKCRMGIGRRRLSWPRFAMMASPPPSSSTARSMANVSSLMSKRVLVPTLSPGDIVLIDNLASHKRPKIRKAIEAEGAELRFLPRYSPDLNPIEMAFSKLKTLLRKASERSVEALWTRIGELLVHFSQNECENYFRAAGYEPT